MYAIKRFVASTSTLLFIFYKLLRAFMSWHHVWNAKLTTRLAFCELIYRSTVDTSDKLWQASSIRGIERSDLCIPRIDPRYTNYMCVRLTRGKSTCVFLSFCVFRSAGGLRRCPFIMYLGIHGEKFARTNPRCSTSVVRQIAARTEPNPRYRWIGPFSEVPNVRAIDGRLYRISNK